MNFRLRSRVFIAFLLIVASGLLITATVSADHNSRTPMENCATHGLGPNFQYAEGSDSPLIHCLADELVRAEHPVSYADALRIVGALDPSQITHMPISYTDALRIVGG